MILLKYHHKSKKSNVELIIKGACLLLSEILPKLEKCLIYIFNSLDPLSHEKMTQNIRNGH